MDTNATAASVNSLWDGTGSVKPRFASITQRYRHFMDQQQYNRDNDMPLLSNQGKQMDNDKGHFAGADERDQNAWKGQGSDVKDHQDTSEDLRENGRVSSAIYGIGTEDGTDCVAKVEEDGASCYLCTHCGKGYDSELELDEHLVQVRGDTTGGEMVSERRVTCESRGIEDGEEAFEGNHDGEEAFEENHHSPVFPASADRRSRESVTSNTITSEVHQSGLDDVRRTRAYSCKFCSKMFDSNSALNVHYTHTHRDKPQYECDLCGRVYGVKRELATHRRLHDGQPTHRCRQCGKEFGTKQLLRKHELWHTGERSHVCPQCGKAFFQKGHLTQHMMIHAGGRPHACRLCQKTFIFKFDLNRHMKIHAERVGNAEESGAASTDVITTTAESINKSNSRTSSEIDQSTAADSNMEMDVPLVVPSLFPAISATPMTSVIQQLHQNSGIQSDALGAGAASSFGLLRSWTPSPGFLETAAGNAQDQHRAALAAAFAQALCHAQQQASIFARFTASSPLLFDNQTYQQPEMDQQQAEEEKNGHNNPTGAPEHDSTSGSSPATVDDPRESLSSPLPACDSCLQYRQRLDASNKRIQDLERDLTLREADVNALNSKIQRVADVASSLLESCSDFDKLWMLHSKQVYSQIQNILNALD